MTGRWRLAIVLVVSTMAWLPSIARAAAQQPAPPPRDGTPASSQPEPTGRIRGRVIAADTRAPLAWATVMVHPVGGGHSGGTVQTDARGTFELTGLSAGEYRITALPPAHRARYLPAHFGAATPYESGMPVRVSPGEVVERIEIALSVAAAVAGRVVDEAGEPLADIRVDLLRTTDVSLPSLEPVPAGRSRAVYTDDAGRFRLFEVAEGEYTLAAVAERPYQRTSASPPTFVTTFYPSVTDQTQSQRIAVKAGQETDGLEIRMVRSRAFGISGSVVMSDGRPIANTSVGLNRYDRFGGGGEELRLDAEGRFAVGGLTPGDYAIVVGPGGRNALGEFASMPVTIVDADVKDIVVITRPTVTVTGRVVFDESIPMTERTKVRQIQSGGEFSLPDVRPGSYRIIAIPQTRLTGGSLYRPALLEALTTDATDVTIGEEERRTVDLRLISR